MEGGNGVTDTPPALMALWDWLRVRWVEGGGGRTGGEGHFQGPPDLGARFWKVPQGRRARWEGQVKCPRPTEECVSATLSAPPPTSNGWGHHCAPVLTTLCLGTEEN